MTALLSGCPACGAELNFKSGSSVVIVCEYCNSVIARTDRALEDLGKVAEVVESGSPLEVGMSGVYRGVAFMLTGRAQLRHAAGGMWDEWYAAFSDGRWGWLAEAQGRFFLTYQAPRSVAAPPFEQLEVGREVRGIPVAAPLVVTEKGEAATIAAEGEIPYRLLPGEEYLYADLSGGGGIFATIDYSEDAPLVYVGRETTLQELGIIATTRTQERAARRVASAQLQCPKCGGPLELRAPDMAERVTCPNCGSLLDINQGRLSYLKALKPGNFAPVIPLGAQVSLRELLSATEKTGLPKAFDPNQANGDGSGNGQGASQPATEDLALTVIGFMTRSVEFEGERYFWDEYLLYHPRVGFRWLVQSDHHWSYVEAVPAGEIVEEEKSVRLRGERFKIFQDAPARVEYVTGEFYWKVTTGERVRAVDYVRAPLILSKEVSGSIVGHDQHRLEAEEVNWSLGRYIPHPKIARLFNVELPAPSTIAPNQPFRHRRIYKYWLLLMAATLALGLLFSMMDSNRKVFEETYQMQLPSGSAIQSRIGAQTPASAAQPQRVAGEENSQVIFSQPFELAARQNIEVTGAANVENNWLYVAGDLINEQTGLVQSFDLPIEYYYGSDSDGSWTEGSREKSVHISALPAGTYTMRLEAQWENWTQSNPPRISVKIVQGTASFTNPVLTLVALSVLPILVLFYQYSFEKRRWADSAFSPYEAGDSSDDEDDDE